MATPAGEVVFLEHWMPGRARLRVPRPRTPAHVRRMAGHVGRSQHVRNVSANPETGSLLITFDTGDPLDLIVDELRLSGLEVMSSIETAGKSIRTQSSGAALVRHIMGRANSTLHVKTRGRVDLRLVVPAVYLLLAARSFMRQRGRLRDAAWYQLLYWAFDSFFKLHEETTLQGGAGTRARVVD